MFFRTIAAVTLIIVAGTATASAETVDDVTKKIAELNEKIHSLQYTTKTETTIKQESMTAQTKSSGKTSFMKKDDKFLMRSEDQSESVTEVMGQKITNKTDTLMVQDGEFIWTYDKAQKTAMKMKFPKEQKPSLDPRETWKHYDLNLRADETIDGKLAHVIEATHKDPQMKAAGKTVFWYEKKTGLTLKMVNYDAAGKPMTTATMSDYKVNETLDPKLFKFEPPAGVQVQDMTKLPGA